MDEIEVRIEQVDKMLQNVNVHKSVGPDGIHPKLLKECHDALAVPITIIINDSFRTGLLQVLWKLAMICPIFKKGSKVVPLNFRPISLTSIVCKIC